MMFNVHNDVLDRVEGYLVPNGFAVEPRIRVTSEGRTVYVGPCDEIIADLPRVGRHQTGLAAFFLDEAKVVGLPECHDLSIYDDESGFQIYRRNLPDRFLQRRLFRLETTLAADSHYAPTFSPYFAYSVPDAHLYGQETVSQLFNLGNYPSMYFDGRVHVKPHQKYLTEQIITVVSVDDPFVALAALIAKAQQQSLSERLDEREFTTLLPPLTFFDAVDIARPERVAKRLGSAPKSVLTALESPLVGLLTSQTPGVGGGRRDIPAALDILSMFDLTILGNNTDHDHADMAAELGLDKGAMPSIAQPAAVLALADALRDVPVLSTVLENDLIVYHCLLQAKSDTTRNHR